MKEERCNQSLSLQTLDADILLGNNSINVTTNTGCRYYLGTFEGCVLAMLSKSHMYIYTTAKNVAFLQTK
jgi:hypothetical protein